MATPNLTPALEDYLETIYLLQQSASEVRVRDIVKKRQVKASSVTPALKRLNELGLIQYIQRESFALTEDGNIAARRVYARHVLLFQFFHHVLDMNEDAAKEEACGLEHALSDEGMDKFVQFFERLSMCPNSESNCMLLKKHGTMTPSDCKKCNGCTRPSHTVEELDVDARARILKVEATGEMRQKLIETGLLPNIWIIKLRVNDETTTILMDNCEIVLTAEEARAIIVSHH